MSLLAQQLLLSQLRLCQFDALNRQFQLGARLGNLGVEFLGGLENLLGILPGGERAVAFRLGQCQGRLSGCNLFCTRPSFDECQVCLSGRHGRLGLGQLGEQRRGVEQH